MNRLGVARTFQNIRLFNTLTVEENVAVGLHNQHHCGMATSILRLPHHWKSEKLYHDRALELLDIFDMAGLADHEAGSLPYGASAASTIVRASPRTQAAPARRARRRH